MLCRLGAIGEPPGREPSIYHEHSRRGWAPELSERAWLWHVAAGAHAGPRHWSPPSRQGGGLAAIAHHVVPCHREDPGYWHLVLVLVLVLSTST